MFRGVVMYWFGCAYPISETRTCIPRRLGGMFDVVCIHFGFRVAAQNRQTRYHPKSVVYQKIARLLKTSSKVRFSFQRGAYFHMFTFTRFTRVYPFALFRQARAANQSQKWFHQFSQNLPNCIQNTIQSSSFFCFISGIDVDQKRFPASQTGTIDYLDPV